MESASNPTPDEVLSAVCVWLRERAEALDRGEAYPWEDGEIRPDGREGVVVRRLADELATSAPVLRRIVGSMRGGH